MKGRASQKVTHINVTADLKAGNDLAFRTFDGKLFQQSM
jgi:hypothetical protein